MFGLHMFNEMENLQREMDQVFRGLGLGEPVRVRHAASRFKLRDAGEAFLVEAPLPGIDSDKLEINVLGRRLNLSGELLAEDTAEGACWHRQERQSGAFQQSINLPAAIDADLVEAEYQHGILKIKLPKAESALPKKIAVKTV